MTLQLIKTPVSDKVIGQLHAGDRVYISGYLCTGRDSAHKRLIELIEKGRKLPIEIKGQFIY
ncbi:MAG: fumarate hydratase C-terminal domain-containing protein [Acidobacteriota bacterium]|nr:fumarate hydratase C-terminal domain-containing protein [Acidobacteriota bacterium]